MTGDTTPPAVRLLAERLWKDYDSQYHAPHITWESFAEEARGHIDALADAGLLCSSPVMQPEEEDGSLRSLPSAAGEVFGDDEPIHGWFGLSYSSYLVLHRTLLQSMPGEWQQEFVHLVDQLRAAFGHIEHTECYDLIPGTEALVNELSNDERKRLGITSSIDDLTEEQYEEWLNQDDNEVFYEDREGRSLEGYSRVVVPGPELIPPYSKGRTRLDIDEDAYRAARNESRHG